MSPDPKDVARIEAAKSASTAQLLMKAARLVDEQALARLNAETGLDVRPAHTKVFPHIDFGGTRITEIARRMKISKQAVGQLVDDLVAMGTVERVPDPTDGRARLVRFATSDSGESVLLEGLQVLGRVEAELAQELGPARWAALHEALSALVPLLMARAAKQTAGETAGAGA